MKRIGIILNAMTQLLGALLCVTLNSNESTSGAALRRSPDRWRKVINAIFFWQDDHCLQAARSEIDDCRALLLAYGFYVSSRRLCRSSGRHGSRRPAERGPD
jgi:hypothetical protein